MALPHLILSDAHSTSVGYSFPTAVANLCVTKNIFAGKYFSYNYIELKNKEKQILFCFVLFFLLSKLCLPKSFQNCAILQKEIVIFLYLVCLELKKLNWGNL